MLRVFRDRAYLVGLIGDWRSGDAVIGFDPRHVLPSDADPFDAVRATGESKESETGFGGGWIGYWGYQLGSRIESLPPSPPRPHQQPDFQLAYYDHVLRLDATSRTWFFEGLASSGNEARLEEHHQQVLDALSQPADGQVFECGPFTTTPSDDGHREAVGRAKARIAAGDIYQANICRRLEATFNGDPLDLFCAGVSELHPRFAAFVRTAHGSVASFSPELFLRRQGARVLTSPIKGTAPLTSAPDDLAASPKNRAENVMIVDLMRNDLGRVCVPGTVRVEHLATAQEHAGVLHLVSGVVGQLRQNADDADLLRATFPPGSVTGAPKVRAMEIIAELERTGREAYTGAIGYVSPVAGLELNVAIRTFEFAEGHVWLGVGGGIVADSDPDEELSETFVKAAPLLQAIGGQLASPPPRDDARRHRVGNEPGHRLPRPAGSKMPRPDPAMGVFETMLVSVGEVLMLDQHLARLSNSTTSLYDRPLPEGTRQLVRTAAVGLQGTHRMRVSVVPTSAGLSAAKVVAQPLSARPTQAWHVVPVVVPGGLGRHKWNDRRMLQVVEPRPGTWTSDCDALLVDTDGAVLETGRGNVFLVMDGSVHTPATDGRILPGVTRQAVIDLLEAAGIAVHETPCALADLGGAHEVFVTNSLGGVRPVVECDGVGSWAAPGPTTAWLQEALLRTEGAAGAVSAPMSAAPRRGQRILVIDNYDSFVYNLSQYIGELAACPTVLRNDGDSVEEVVRLARTGAWDGIVISPGPGVPGDAGMSSELVARLAGTVPILGVCLGHQCIAETFGARVGRVETILHGKSSLVQHDGQGVFAAMAGPLTVGRYHSLVVEPASLPQQLIVTARTVDGVIMGVRHRDLAVEGVQFHPESILTPRGHELMANFLRMCT